MQTSLNSSMCHTTLVSSPDLPVSLCKVGIDAYEKLSPYSVVIGREKACRKAMGNKRLNVLAANVLSQYTDAASRKEKSEIVSALVESVHAAGGAFVRFSNGQFVNADRSASREKVGVVLRDLASDKYRSSTKAKVIARRHRVQLRRQESQRKKLQEVDPLPPSKICSSDIDVSLTGEDTNKSFIREKKGSITSVFDFPDLPLSIDCDIHDAEFLW